MALTKPQGNMLMKLGTEQASTSGTSVDFAGIPAGTTHIIITLEGVSTNGTSDLAMRVGTGGSPATSGYVGAAGQFYTASASAAADTGFFPLTNTVAVADTYTGLVMLTLKDATNNTWVGSSVLSSSGATPAVYCGTSSVSLAGALDIVRILTGVGDTFDAGSINIAYF